MLHVVVISGELEMNIEGVWRTIYADSGVRFAGDKPHDDIFIEL